MTQCLRPSERFALAQLSGTTDCDDTTGAINPAAIEINANGFDNNCDGIEMCYMDTDNDMY